MNVMFVLHSKHAFSDALEGVASKSFARSARVSTTSFLLHGCSQLIAYLTCYLTKAKLFGYFHFALFHYIQWQVIMFQSYYPFT